MSSKISANFKKCIPEKPAYLHVTNSNTVVSAISYDFVFNFLPTLHGLFNKHLGRSGKSLATQLDQLLFVLSETGTQTTECVSGSDDNGETNRSGSGNSFIDTGCSG
jgi:hypothetical protein